MTSGEFARASRLSRKALRLYDELALLSPVQVDPVTGYRLYAPAQFEQARLVREARPGDRYLLCSDGLHETADADSIAQVLRSVSDPDQAAAELVALAIAAGGPDNVTCIVADVVAAEACAGTPAAAST